MRFSGNVGFWVDEIEVQPGIWKGSVIERHYVGEIRKNNRQFQPSGDQVNDEFTVNNRISILSDIYAKQNWASIRYVVWNGKKWKVKSVDIDYPRIVLEIGGIYNGQDIRDTPMPIVGNTRC